MNAMIIQVCGYDRLFKMRSAPWALLFESLPEEKG